MPSNSEPGVDSFVVKRWSQLTTDELYAFLKVRTDVFFVEQRVDEEELDGRDREPETVHVWIEREGSVAAYLRVLVNAEPEHRDARRVIGRVVVAPGFRRQGLASRLLEWTIGEFGGEALLLHSQSYVADLYAGFGFEVFGDEYLEAGIPHLSMYRPGSGSAEG